MNPRPPRLLAAALAAVLLAPAAAPSAQPTGAKPGAPAAGMRARPVHIEIDAPLPKDLPSDLMLGNNASGGYAVTYLVRGKGISGIDGDSLRIASATVGGADVAKDDRGRDAWSFGPFPRVADDGSAATFEVRGKPGAGRVKSGVPVLHGSIDVTCATGRETKTAALSVKPGSTAQLGPIQVTVPADEDEDDGGADDANAGAAFAEMIAQQAGAAGEDGGDDDGGNAEMAAALLAGMFGGGGGSGFDLEVTGDGSALATLVLVVDGKDVEPRSWMNFGRGTTYGFPAVKGDTVRVKAEFWTGQRTETVSF